MRAAILSWCVVVACAACGASAELRSAYATQVAACIAEERAIVARDLPSHEDDQEIDIALLEARSRCDEALAVLEDGQ